MVQCATDSIVVVRVQVQQDSSGYKRIYYLPKAIPPSKINQLKETLGNLSRVVYSRANEYLVALEIAPSPDSSLVWESLEKRGVTPALEELFKAKVVYEEYPE